MKRRYPAAAVLLAAIILLIYSQVILAAEANTHFGSAGYAKYTGETFNVGIYLESAEAFTEYSIILSYDPAYVEYLSGALSGGEGTVVLGGIFEDGSGYVKTMLQFRALAAGDTSLSITEAAAVDAEGNAFEIVNQGTVPLLIREDVPVYLDGITIGGQALEGFAPGIFTYELQVPYETENLEIETLGYAAAVSGTELQVGENTIDIRLTSPGGIQTVYTLHVTREEDTAGVVEAEGQSGEAERAGTDEQTGEAAQTEGEGQSGEAERAGTDGQSGEAEGSGTDGQSGEAEGSGTDGRTGEGQTGGAAQTEGEGQTAEIPVVETAYEDEGVGSLLSDILKKKIIYLPVLAIVLVAVVISTIQTCLEDSRKSKESGGGAERKREEKYGWTDPIIIVEDVCMDFEIATQNVSGIKEWVIKKLRGKISYRTLHALRHISFFVYPGEVIGIIGTNGSGKSTLLKIISGVLTPTSGYVKVDRSKIQLLTLGTGFDMELTAKENVYLNGSIIGYSREFIDEHYDAIVEFAELEGFMEEKVKNFSSGMVSRLGFAIATAGDAAEILILDEVLSVGDEFFRKKSLKRIKEMIHGGSTVLMVSHGMGTILENCTRAVWVEKGKMKMVGDVERVCEAYRRMNG